MVIYRLYNFQTKKGTVKNLFFTVPVEFKGIGKRLQNG